MKFNDLNEGYSVLPNIDTDRYGDRSGEGLEGPFRASNGKVVYYDAKAGMYYDPDTDFYLSYDEWKEMNESVTEGAIKVKSTDLHDLVVQMVQDIDYNETKKLADIARALGKEVFYQNDKVVLQDPDFDYNAETVQEADQDWGSMSKREFKRAELQQELGHEDEWEKQRRAQQKPILQKYVFFNVPADKEDQAKNIGLKQTKSGKWYVGVYNTSGASTANKIYDAETVFGPGKDWTPKPKNESKKTIDEKLDKEDLFHKSVENGKFMTNKNGGSGDPNTMYLHDLDNVGSDEGRPMMVTFAYDNKKAAEKAAKKFGGKLFKTRFGTFRIIKDSPDLEEALTEAQFDEAAGEKDACYHKVKSRYKVWPSAYASGALVQCRKVGAANWGNKK